MNPSSELETLWHDHHTKLLNYVKRRVFVDAEDVAQDVWLSALEAMQQDNGAHTHASGWLYRIAHNRIIDGYRGRQRQPQWVWLDEPVHGDEDGRTQGEMVVDDAPEPNSLLEQAEIAATIERAIDTLTDDQMQVIRFKLAGMEHAEIAPLVNKTVDACKAIQHRALGRLHVVLANKMERDTTDRYVPKSNCIDQVCALLMEHGPLTASQIVRLSRLKKGSIHYALYNGRAFVMLGKRQVRSMGVPSNVWGVRGVHDSQEVAA